MDYQFEVGSIEPSDTPALRRTQSDRRLDPYRCRLADAWAIGRAVE